MLARFMQISPTVAGMCGAGSVVLVIGLLAARNRIAGAHGLDKIVALANVCVAVPLAVFGALHLFGARIVLPLVPPYMPGRMFWAYAVGVALVAAALSIAVNVAVRWSGLLYGIMMFLFVAMIHFPGALRTPHERIIWMIVFRELSFGGAGWMLAGLAMNGRRPGNTLILVGRVLVTAALIVFGVEHFLHPTGMPGVPLAKQMPAWVPLRPLIGYVTGAALLAVAVSALLRKSTRTTVAACAGAWLLLLLLVIYVPVMIGALSGPGLGVQLEGVNYFADTLLFTGGILTLARAASPRSDL